MYIYIPVLVRNTRSRPNAGEESWNGNAGSDSSNDPSYTRIYTWNCNENILIYSNNMSIYILAARIETATQVATVVRTRPVRIHLHLYAWKHTWEYIDRFTSEIYIHIGNVYVEIHNYHQYVCPPKRRLTWARRRSCWSYFNTMYYVLLFWKYNISYTALWRINKALSYKVFPAK